MAETTIAVSFAVRDRLRSLGVKGEPYDVILRRLLKLEIPPPPLPLAYYCKEHDEVLSNPQKAGVHFSGKHGHSLKGALRAGIAEAT